MKKYKIFFLLVVLMACKSAKQSIVAENAIVNFTSDCPKEGTCTVKLLHNKAVVTKTDENGENFQYNLIADTTKTTIVYEYSKNVPKGIMDAGLREEIVITIDNNIKEGRFTDFQSAVFGRFCYCKGYTGYYKIKRSVLTVINKNQQQYFNFQFKVDDVPQITQSIDFSIK
ncbi:MAG: hypothetical protein PSV16_02565 [Flavobacterium sp.]|nr:hypothetical protein [Flavobacterium sp.]